METITIQGLTLATEQPAVRAAGGPPREPLLFVHGYLATAWMWERYLAFFAQLGHPCYALNLRGRCGSRPTARLGAVSMAEFIEDADDAARALGSPIVFGHSMGGLIALALAERGRAAAAVLVSPAPPHGIPIFSWGLARRMLPYLPAILRSREVPARFDDLRALVLNCMPPEEQRAAFAHFVPDSGRAGRDMILGSVRVDPRRTRCPLLVVGADADRFLPLRIARKVADRYQASFVVARGHGHASVHEPGWEALAREIAQWLDAGAASRAATRERVIA